MLGVKRRGGLAIVLGSSFCRAFSSKSNQYPPFVYHEAYSCPWPETHRFPMAKFRILKETLTNSGAFRGTFEKPPHPLETEDGMNHVYAVHDVDYVDRFVANQLTAEEKRRIGLDFNEHLVYRTLAEVSIPCHHSLPPIFVILSLITYPLVTYTLS